jgi:hypothetical protein
MNRIWDNCNDWCLSAINVELGDVFVAFCLIGWFLFVVYSRRKAKKQIKSIFEQIGNRIELSVNNIKCSGYILGFLERRLYPIRTKCNMYITDDALILLDGSDLVVFTYNLSYGKFRSVDIYNKFTISFNKYVIIKARRSLTRIKIKLKTLTDAEKNELQRFANANDFIIIHNKKKIKT